MLIEVDRLYRSKVALGRVVDPDERGVELWPHSPIRRSTAISLVDAGLAELVNTRINPNKWLFLGSCNPYDEVEQG
jgi:hypothetical protein